MILVIDLSKKEPWLILKKGKKQLARQSRAGFYHLDETLLPEIDRFLNKNQIRPADLEKIRVIPSKESIVSTRIAKAVALGLKMPA